MKIHTPNLFFTNSPGELNGKNIGEKTARIADLKGIFADEAARTALPKDLLAYHVQYYFPVAEGTEGGLFFGNTTIYSGKIGDEYLMPMHKSANCFMNCKYSDWKKIPS